MAVRRHIGPVMVMMTVMAVDLHLFPTYGINPMVSIAMASLPDIIQEPYPT